MWQWNFSGWTLGNVHKFPFTNINNDGHEVVNRILQPKAGKHVVRDKGFPTHVTYFFCHVGVKFSFFCFPDVKVKFKDTALLFETMIKGLFKKIYSCQKKSGYFNTSSGGENTSSIVGAILTDIIFHVMVKREINIQYKIQALILQGSDLCLEGIVIFRYIHTLTSNVLCITLA